MSVVGLVFQVTLYGQDEVTGKASSCSEVALVVVYLYRERTPSVTIAPAGNVGMANLIKDRLVP